MRIRPMSFVAAAAVSMAALAGCSNKTEGDRTLERAKTVEDAGMMIKRGEQTVADGRATEARGRALKDQGNHVEGDKLVEEGRSMQRKGQADIDAGRRLKM